MAERPSQPSEENGDPDAGPAPVDHGRALERLRAAARDGGVVQLTGPPGAGKTRLLRRIISEQADAGVPSLHVRPAAGGRLDPYGVVAALAEADGRGSIAGVAPPEVLPTPRATAAAGDDDGAAQPHDGALGGLPRALDLDRQRAEAAQHALDLVVEILSEERLVVVDDTHWSDAESLDCLTGALDELAARGLRPRLVCAGRPLGDRRHLREPTRRFFAIRAAQHVRLAAPVGRRATDPRTPGRGGASISADPGRERLAGLIGADEEAARALLAAGVLAEALPRVSSGAVAEASGLDPGAARAALLRLGELGAVRLVDEGWVLEPPSGPVDLLEDPIFAADVRLRAGRWIARAAPGRPEQAARVLLHASPAGDPRIAEVFLRAARAALARGAPEAAAELLGRAEVEPPAAEQHARLALERAFVAESRGEHGESERHAAHATELAPTPAARTEAALALSRLQLRHGKEVESLETLERAADACAPTTEERQVLEREIMSIGHGGEYQYAAATRRARALRDSDLPARHPVREQAETFLIPIDGSAREVASRLAPRIEQDVGIMRDLPPITVLGSAWMLIRAELWETALLVLDAAARDVERRGVVAERGPGAERPVLRSLRSLVELCVGDPRRALHLSRDAMDHLDGEDWTLPMRHGAGIAARVATACGAPQDALAALARVQPDHDAPFSTGPSRPSLYIARAEARLALGDHDAALNDARTAEDLKLTLTVPNPSGFPWAIVACAVLVARGEIDQARRIAREDLRGAQKWGAPMALSTALRAVAMSSPAGERERVLRAALRRVEPTTLHLERIRVMDALATALAEAGRDTEAARFRARAIDAAARFGHRVVAGEAGALLLEGRATEPEPARARPATEDAPPAGGEDPAAVLTPMQRQVAALLVEGRTNPTIAEALAVGPRTVQTHVRDILRRTGSTTRTEAAHKLRGHV